MFESVAERHQHSDPLGALYHAAERPYIICKAYIMQPTAVYHCEASAVLSGRANFAARPYSAVLRFGMPFRSV